MPDEAMKILNIEKSALNKESIESQYKKFYHSNDPAKVYYYLLLVLLVLLLLLLVFIISIYY